MKLLVFAGALRKDSLNKKYAREAMRIARELGAEDVEFLDLKEYPMPVYDGDIEESSGIPETTRALSKKIAAVDGVILSTPEYNASIPGALKNVVDWLSRDKPVALGGKHLLLLAASPGAVGGMRVLWNARQPFEMLSMHVYPSMLGLPFAGAAFDDNGRLKDEKTAESLKKLLDGFIKHVKGKVG